MRHPRLTDDADETIRHLYEHDGLTIYEIAERLGSYPSLIYYRAKRAGVKFRPRHVWRGSIFPARDDDLIRDYRDGMPLSGMAANACCAAAASPATAHRMQAGKPRPWAAKQQL